MGDEIDRGLSCVKDSHYCCSALARPCQMSDKVESQHSFPPVDWKSY